MGDVSSLMADYMHRSMRRYSAASRLASAAGFDVYKERPNIVWPIKCNKRILHYLTDRSPFEDVSTLLVYF